MLLNFFALFYSCVCMIAIPVFGHYNLYQIIDDTKFKRIKIYKGQCFFRAIGSQSVEKHGLLIPIFWLQLLSYPLSIITFIVGTIYLLLNVAPIRFIRFSFVLLGIEVLIDLIIIIVLFIISRKRLK